MILRNIAASLAILFAGLGGPALAQDVDTDQNVCSFYSKIGSELGAFMLPLTLQQMVDMMQGRDEQLKADMVQIVLDISTGPDMVALLALGEDVPKLVGNAAGQTGIKLLMSGQASSADEVRNLMMSHCIDIGAAALIQNQRDANAANAANLPGQ